MTWIRRVMPNVVAGDLDASRSFYTEFLGLEISMHEDPDGTVINVHSHIG